MKRFSSLMGPFWIMNSMASSEPKNAIPCMAIPMRTPWRMTSSFVFQFVKNRDRKVAAIA